MDIAPIVTVDELIDLLATGDGARDSPRPDGAEPVDLLAHGLQCAHLLSITDPGDVELQVAGLVHDLGHLLVPGDDAGHGRAGADAVRDLLGDRVARLVDWHVSAKRYLVATDHTYASHLSVVSVRSLTNQGGALTPADAAALERRSGWDAAVRLRRADDRAKIPGRRVPGLDHWRAVVATVADRDGS